MTEKKKPPPGEYSAFKALLEKIAKVPKKEVDKQETEYRAERESARRKREA